MKKALPTIVFCILAAVARLLSVAQAWTTATTARPPPRSRRLSSVLAATVAPPTDGSSVSSSWTVGGGDEYKQQVLQTMNEMQQEANQYADMFDLDTTEAAFYALFVALSRVIPLGLQGQPVCLRRQEIIDALNIPLDGYFTMQDLEKALNDDFLDAARGSTDNRQAWKITDVSVPRGDSFEEARMTFGDVQNALEKGTVIFNAAGAHIPKLARPTLCCTDAATLPAALNLYVTAAGKRTSAPPHTDKQDVVVVQSTGAKHWRVYSPPDPTHKADAEIFARGKGDDALPLHLLQEFGCKLLLETVLTPGDVLYIPAAFPHTTSTASLTADNVPDNETSIHLTINLDHHIWELDYLSARRLALRRAHVADTALEKATDGQNYYTGKCNLVADETLRNELFSPLPLGFLSDNQETAVAVANQATTELERISKAIDVETANAVPPAVWKETIEQLQQQGKELLEIHRDMYLAAIEEGRLRESEDAMTAHLDSGSSSRSGLSPERMQRLSLFRVKKFYDKINESKESLKEWSFAGESPEMSSSTTADAALPSNWAFSMPVKVGDRVEADLGGAFFPATVSRASGGTFDVQFFDGDRETNLDRSQIKLMAPPATAISGDDVDTSKMTPKQLKRWKKEQQKLQK